MASVLNCYGFVASLEREHDRSQEFYAYLSTDAHMDICECVETFASVFLVLSGWHKHTTKLLGNHLYYKYLGKLQIIWYNVNIKTIMM